MFVQSEKFIEAHQGRLDDISIYGQESNETTYKLCRMNLAIRGIDGSNIKWNPEGSFLNDAHKDLADLVDCIVMLPTQLFYNTGIPACLWFLSRYKNVNKSRSRKGEVLFIDASELGYMVNRRNRAFSDENIAKIADTYHEWKKKPSPLNPLPESEGNYKDVKGFCKSATLAEIEKHNFVLTPGRYVGIPDEEDDGISFEETMEVLTKELAEQMREGLALDKEIKIQLEKVGFSLGDF